jgi:hypothetical protein
MVTSNAALSPATRCPSCGQRLDDESLRRCSICGYDFAVDRSATSDDSTPFADAYSRDQPGHRLMWKWVWTATSGRMKHMALMRTSAASASFAIPYWLLLAAVMGMLLAGHFGWRAVSASPGVEATGAIRPQGRGWLHLAAMPLPHRNTQPAASLVDLWWSPPQIVLAGVGGFLTGLLLLWFVWKLVTGGIERAHHPVYRGEGRMSAAVQYSLAWSVPFLAVSFLLVLRPVARTAAILRWSWFPPRSAIEWAAALVTAVTFIGWWFWLLRLGSAAPADTRTRVEWFCGLGVPLIVGGAAIAWWLGSLYGLTYLFESWKLLF